MAMPRLASVDPPPVLYRPESGARQLGISRAFIYKLMDEGAIRSVKVGRLRRIPHTALVEYVERLIAEQEPAEAERQMTA